MKVRFLTKSFKRKESSNSQMVINSFLQNFIINPYQLRKIKNSEDLKIIDCRWYLKEPRRGRIEFKRSHIEKAIFFDVDRLSNTSSKIPHMLPTANQFSRFVQKIIYREMTRSLFMTR